MPRLIRAVVAELETPRPERPFGSGWLSGAGALLASLTSLVAAICLHWPSLLMTPELRVVTDSSWFRPALLLVLALAYAFSFISLILRDNKLLPFTALAIAVIAALMGGPEASANAQVETPVYFGLDFFVLNVLFTGFLFVPVERLLPHRKSQTLFRQEWREDMFYFLVSSLFVQVMAFLTLEPSKVVNAVTHFEIFKQAVGSQPLILQIVEIMILTDFVQYWVHRLFHQIPFLWGFHAVHHSAKSMDWLAGARMHFFEIIALRSTTAIPMFTLGFGLQAIQAYLLIVYIYSAFIHANFGANLNALGPWVVTPRFHHWHHGLEAEAINVNYAIHFPIFDRLFGTYHLPQSRWPDGYGVPEPVPVSYLRQFLYPFQRRA
jgi:sterol desaturase/sphingolipid hydroxylase (fatty acid hydroxylase superfamily)